MNRKARTFLSAVVVAGLLGAPTASWCGVAGAASYYQQAATRKPAVRECEVAAYGGTPAKVTAAIEAARQGRKTSLLPPIGGAISGDHPV